VLVVWSNEEEWGEWGTCDTENVLMNTRYWYETWWKGTTCKT